MRIPNHGGDRPRKRGASASIQDDRSRMPARRARTAGSLPLIINRIDADRTERKADSPAGHDRLPKQPVRERIHNIMSPLNAVSGYVDLLQSNARNPKAGEHVERYSRKIAQGLEQISDQLEELQHYCKTGGVTERPQPDREEIRRSIRSLVSGMSI